VSIPVNEPKLYHFSIENTDHWVGIFFFDMNSTFFLKDVVVPAVTQ